MRAVTWQGKRNMAVIEVPDPVIIEPTDAIIKITSSGICGSDLHLYEVMTPFMNAGDIVGHEPMGIVQEIGSGIKNLKVGDRVVIPFNISCGYCYMCNQGLQSQCETTQVREFGRGAQFFGYSKLYGQVPGGQAEYLRVPHADYGAIVVPQGPPDDRFLYLSDVLPTAWQAVEYANIPQGGSVAIVGLGPIGEMSARIALHRGASKVIGIDIVPERLARAKTRGVEIIDASDIEDKDVVETVKALTDGRGVDSSIDAVGMEAHGSPFGAFTQQVAGLLPDAAAEKLFTTAGLDRLNGLYRAIDIVRRGGTLSIIGVYAGQVDPISLDTLFDRQIQIRMGQANVRNWTKDLMPLLIDQDVLGVDDFATHHLPLSEAPTAYEIFQKKQDGAIKIVLKP
ncbi:MAG: Alcohol dehydrogenase GroES domain protein [Candidatus Saccharibacteria bacterium]|nr:Alcohol dehydrogenase GroES domain protein [Candidatus Saccharibacteria bacterium]